MPNSKHHLAEVLCGFWFDNDSNNWDSTYFGKYFEKVSELGFTEKQEQKAVQVKFDLNPTQKGASTSEMKEGEMRMVFKNPEINAAIILSRNYISFHKLPDYKGWDLLISEIVNPCLKAYREIGLGNNLVQVQSLYLNKYILKLDKKLSELFSFLPNTEDFGIGFEHNLVFQSQYELDPNINVTLKLNCNSNNLTKEKVAMLECSSFAKKINDISEDELIKSAHDKTNLVFNKIINK